MTLLEAQVCGLPLVSYACKCGPRDIIKDGINGYLIEENDQKEMIQKLIHLMNDEKFRKQMGDASYRFSDNYSEDRIMQQWIDLFKEVNKNNEKTIVISAVNLVEAGTLAILKDCLSYLSALAEQNEYRIVAIVYKKN